MKMKHKSSEGEWEVDYIAATNPKTGEVRNFYGGYDLISDDEFKTTPPTCLHVETKIAELDKTVALLSKTMSTLSESLGFAHGRLDELEPKSPLDPHERIDTLR